MKKITKCILAVAIITAFIILYPYLSDLANVDVLRNTIEPFGVFASLAFAIIYIIAGLLFLPLSVFSIAAGTVFGLWQGLIIVLISATIAAAVSFIIARQFTLPEAKRGIIQKLQKTVERYLEKNTFQAIFILRLLYLPYIALSYAAGLVKACTFWPFVWATFLTNIVGSFVFVYFGDQLGRGLSALIIPVILIALSLLIPYVTRKLSKKRINNY